MYSDINNDAGSWLLTIHVQYSPKHLRVDTKICVLCERSTHTNIPINAAIRLFTFTDI